ncbi:MAG: hypothetical protein GY903_32940 [Fuerstiella sp.]|nr:hypothetical protein [Fuerstiella sp.]MCP4787241.1 hypothetical protein [Fuerstiella sp.]MCP4859299.1 hypothetical protein [Fuerstiella sp.]
MIPLPYAGLSTQIVAAHSVTGVSLAVVTEVLGHENSQVTLERYSHVLKADHEQVKTFWNRAKLSIKRSG